MSGCLSKYTRYISADTASRREEIEGQIKKSLEDIEENSETVRGLKRLSVEKLDQVRSECEKLWGDALYDYLQQELNVTFDMRNWNVRCKELGDVFFYYLMRDEVPDSNVVYLIRWSSIPVSNVQYFISEMYSSRRLRRLLSNWYELCCHMMYVSDVTFKQFYKRLGNNSSNLEYLTFKQPQLLLNNDSIYLIEKLKEHLPRDNLRQILLNTRDEKNQTFMFYMEDYWWDIDPLIGLYKEHIDDLCELLSVQNKNNQTAFHVNTDNALVELLPHITLTNRDQMMKLLSIKDNNNKTVYDTASDNERLIWLKNQIERGNYPLFFSPRVLILYNTNNRSGAKEEAFESVTFSPVHIELEKMGTSQEVLQLIKKTAAKRMTSALIVCVMSHGNIGTIDDCMGEPISLTSIEGAMCSKRLNERPKVLITQSCQVRSNATSTAGETTSTNEATDPGPSKKPEPNTPYEPTSKDFLSVQACLSGEKSVRNVFIPCLAEQIKKSTKEVRFGDLVEDTIQEMRKQVPQTPIVKSTLGGRVCLKDSYIRND